MTPSRRVWLSPRDVRRDFGPVDAIADQAEGAFGQMRYIRQRSRRSAALLGMGAAGSGIAIAAPVLAIGGVAGALCAIAIGALYVTSLRLSLTLRARDRSIGHHGSFLPKLSRIGVQAIRRRPALAAMRLVHALSARQALGDIGDLVLAILLRAAAPLAAGLWLASAAIPLATALSAAALLGFMLAGLLCEDRRLTAGFRAEISNARFGKRVGDLVRHLPLLCALGEADRAIARLRRRAPIAAQHRAASAALRTDALFRLGVPSVPIVAMLLAQDLTPGAILGLAIAATASAQAGAAIGVQATRLALARRRLGSADRLLPPPHETLRTLDRLDSIAIRDLSFCYPDAQQPVFEDRNFELRSGEVLALASASGTGKTTLLRVLTGLAEPCAGEVLVNGASAHELGYRHRVAAVFQDEPIGAGTIRSAIAGRVPLDLDAVWALAERVGAAALIRSLPMQMQTLIVEGPFPPSLLQPLLVARALAQSPDLLILDEALGALPYARAADLLAGLRAEGRLVIFASHDPQMVELADKVLALPG